MVLSASTESEGRCRTFCTTPEDPCPTLCRICKSLYWMSECHSDSSGSRDDAVVGAVEGPEEDAAGSNEQVEPIAEGMGMSSDGLVATTGIAIGSGRKPNIRAARRAALSLGRAACSRW